MAIPAVVISKIQGSVAKLTLMQQANKLRAFIKQGNAEGLKKLVSSLKPDVLAKLISQLSSDEKAELVKHVKNAYGQNIPEHVAVALGIEIADEPKMVASLKYVDPGKAAAAGTEGVDEPHFDQPASEVPPLPKVLVELKESIEKAPISQKAIEKLSAQIDQFWADHNNADLPAGVRKAALQKLETLSQLVGLKKEVGKAQKLIKKFKAKYPKAKKWQALISQADKALGSGQYALAFAHLETARAILKTNGLIKQLKGFLKNASLDKDLKEQYGSALSSLKLYKKALYDGNVEKASKHGKKADKWLKKAEETAQNIARANKQQIIKSGQKLVNEFGPGTTIYNLLKQAYPQAMQALAEDFKTLKFGKVDEGYVEAIKRVDKKIRQLIHKLDLKEFSKAVRGIQNALKGLATEHSKIPALQMQILRSLIGDDDVSALGFAPAFNQLKKNYGGVSGIFQLAHEKTLVQLLAALKDSGDTKAYKQAVAQVTDLSRCHTVSDLVVMLNTVLDLKHAGLLNWGPKKMEAYLKQIQDHQLIKNAQKDIEIGQIIATIEVITAAAAVSAICGAFALPAMGLSASTIGGFFVYNGINALVFTSLYKPMAVGMELEENLWQSPTEYLTDFGKNYAMFLVLGGASKGFQALVKAPTTILGKVAYGAGELATEYAAFNAWSLTEQAVHAGLSEELKVADVLTAENVGNVSKQNAILLLGLKMGGLITRPVVGPITRGLLAEAHVSKLSAYEAKAEKLAKKTQQLYEKGGKPKEFIKLYKQQNKLLKERISLMKEIDNGSGVYAEEIKALEQLYAEQTKVAEHSATILPEGKVIVFEAKAEKPSPEAKPLQAEDLVDTPVYEAYKKLNNGELALFNAEINSSNPVDPKIAEAFAKEHGALAEGSYVALRIKYKMSGKDSYLLVVDTKSNVEAFLQSSLLYMPGKIGVGTPLECLLLVSPGEKSWHLDLIQSKNPAVKGEGQMASSMKKILELNAPGHTFTVQVVNTKFGKWLAENFSAEFLSKKQFAAIKGAFNPSVYYRIKPLIKQLKAEGILTEAQAKELLSKDPHTETMDIYNGLAEMLAQRPECASGKMTPLQYLFKVLADRGITETMLPEWPIQFKVPEKGGKKAAEAKKPEKGVKLQRDEDAEAAAAQAEQQFLKEAEALAKEWQAALDLQFGKTQVDVNEVAKVQSQAQAKEPVSVSKPIIIESDGKVIKYKLEFDDGQVVTLDSGIIGKDGKVNLAGGHENYDQLVQKYGPEKAEKIVEYRQKLVSGKKAPPPLPAKAAKKGATPPPIPADAKKAGKKPPPLPPAAKKVQSGAYAKMTVADLAGKYLKQGVDYLKFITGLNSKGQAVEGFERPAAASGKPGAVVEVKGDKKMIFVGDLHANIENLNLILSKYGEALQKGEAVLVFLGDAIHPENGNMADMKSSIQTMDAILQLTAEGKAIYLKGNHDEVWGGGERLFAKKNDNGAPIFQGVEFQNQFYAHKKAEYQKANPNSSDAAASAYAQKCAQALQTFYDNAPLILVKDGPTGLIAGHTPVLDSMTMAMATTGGVELKDALINARSNPDLVSSLTWSRPEKQASKNDPFKFSQADIESMILELDLPAQTLVLTGHTHSGSQQAVYLPPGTKGVATIMSSYKDALSVVEVNNGYSSFVDLKGQSALGGKTAGKPQTAAAAK